MAAPASSIRPFHPCTICHNPTTKSCGKCQQVYYCTIEHQRQHWPLHRTHCAHKVATLSDQDRCTHLLALVQNSQLRQNYALSRRMYDLSLVAIPEGLNPLLDSPGRINMWLTTFAYPAQNAWFDTCADLPGIEIIQREPEFRMSNPHDCSWFVFHEKPWYCEEEGRERSALLECLFAPHNQALLFLQQKGYVHTMRPRIGNIVIYATNVYGGFNPQTHRDFKVSHYGRVIEVQQDDTVIIESKFGHGHTYHHRLDMIPYYLGNAYTFMAPPSSLP